jgi:hypothetical protein
MTRPFASMRRAARAHGRAAVGFDLYRRHSARRARGPRDSRIIGPAVRFRMRRNARRRTGTHAARRFASRRAKVSGERQFTDDRLQLPPHRLRRLTALDAVAGALLSNGRPRLSAVARNGQARLPRAWISATTSSSTARSMRCAFRASAARGPTMARPLRKNAPSATS